MRSSAGRLDFVPLTWERFDLVLRPHEVSEDEEMLREILGERRPEVPRGRRRRRSP